MTLRVKRIRVIIRNQSQLSTTHPRNRDGYVLRVRAIVSQLDKVLVPCTRGNPVHRTEGGVGGDIFDGIATVGREELLDVIAGGLDNVTRCLGERNQVGLYMISLVCLVDSIHLHTVH